jgi:hypothetical protein
MANRHHHHTGLVETLRLTIDCLPVITREAMLEGIRSNERIIVGAYVDGEGGVCPMLAAHQAGGRTSFLPFAKSWDRFTRAKRGARPATKRELAILVGQLQASLLSEADIDLDRAIEEHRELLGRHEPQPAPEPMVDPTGELIARRPRWPSRWSRRRGDGRAEPRPSRRRRAGRASDTGRPLSGTSVRG